MSRANEDKIFSAMDQAFLVSDEIFLRGVADADVAEAASWYPPPYPAPLEVLEERIREQLSADAEDNGYTLIARRSEDQRIVGSLFFWTEDWRWGYARPWADPVLSEEERGAIMAEIVRVAVPWLIDDPGFMAVMVEVPLGTPGMDQGFTGLEMRFAYRQREAMLVDGQRRDLVAYQAFNPEAIAVFGAPPDVEEGPVAREVRSSARLSVSSPGADRPSGAIVIGERLYLRSIEPDDAELMAEWSLREQERFHIPRWARSQTIMAAQIRKVGEELPPTWARFAIVRRDNDELIGVNALNQIDPIHRSAETESNIFRADDRNQGFGTEAKHLLLSWGFDRLGLHMVWSTVWEPNHRSAAALLKQGYRQSGMVHWRHFANGRPRGEWTFDLLADEWRSHRR
jgi:RimJ/RimL family protein N-acetyltransferase